MNFRAQLRVLVILSIVILLMLQVIYLVYNQVNLAVGFKNSLGIMLFIGIFLIVYFKARD